MYFYCFLFLPGTYSFDLMRRINDINTWEPLNLLTAEEIGQEMGGN